VIDKTMIMSLGGSPEPLIKSIENYKPEQIIFLASHDSATLAGNIFKALEYRPRALYEITEDPNVMFECYKAARRCVDRVKKMGILPQGVMVDYTGGTKVMTAALILATIDQPYRFNYVGGEQRSKKGLGVVMNGQEKMFAEMNPWSVFAEEERRQIITLFNRRRFSSVMQIIDACLTRELPLEISGYLRFVQPLAKGFLFWEQFNHKEANIFLGTGLHELRQFLNLFPDSDIKGLLMSVQQCKKYLERLIAETKGLQTMRFIIVEDLLNNARRRMADKRYDDAAARIYRAMELYGQICFFEVTGYTNDKVPLEMIPMGLRQDFPGKYQDGKSRLLKLPLTATFLFLKHRGHEAGIRYFDREKEIKNITSNRNQSILAHGIVPVSENACLSIFKTVSDFVGFKNTLDFPQLP
jgi:CRISPR-associated protein (TIGR02710 family)